MNILDKITAKKREFVELRKSAAPMEEITSRIKDAPKARGFINAIRDKAALSKPALITEIKRASPSKGMIRENLDPAEIARTYEKEGSCCVSVLTDEPYFKGSDKDFLTARSAASIPFLRKDFMIDLYQIYESRTLGADCVLLIMACLSDGQASKFYETAKEIGCDVLVEVHNKEELERALKFSPEMIGINNRNLKTMTVDLGTSLELANMIPNDTIKVSESGIKDADDIKNLQKAGFSAFLIGETLMSNENTGETLRNLCK